MFEFHRIVITTGISLFATYNTYGKWARTLNIFEFPRSNPKPLSGDNEDTAFEKWKQACQSMDFNHIEDPKLVSAEFSLLHALAEQEQKQKQKRLGKKPDVVLIHTDTLGGKAAVHLLIPVLERRFNAQVTPRSIKDFDVDNPQRLRQSLGDFMYEVSKGLEGYDVKSTCFAPVGGYKVMTSLGYLAGAYMGFPTAYLHEDGQMLHEIAAVPIQIKREDLSTVAPLMLSADNLPSWDSLSSKEQEQVETYPYLFEQIDGSIALSPFSYFLKERSEYRDLFAPIKISSEVQRTIRGLNLSFIEQQLRELQKKIKKHQYDENAYRNELQHEITFNNLKGCTFSLYKCGARTPIFRAAYKWEKATNTLYVNRLWTNHDAYEHDATQGIGLFDNPEKMRWHDFEK